MSVLLTPENVLKLNNGTKERSLINQRNLIHKVTVINGALENKDKLLRMIMDFVYPHDFIPINYHVIDNEAMFLIQNCGPALEHLCRNNLIAFNMKLNLALAHTDESHVQVDFRRGITQALQKCYNYETKTLDLTEFHKNKYLNPEDYCALSQPRLLKNVLSLLKPMDIKVLILAKNHLRHLKEDVVRILHPKKNMIKTIDLSNNDLENLDAILPLRSMDLSEICLDENPLCHEFDEYNYIKNIRNILPTLKILDGLKLTTRGFLAFRRNYMINRNLANFVNDFIEHYFNLYDSNYRYVLSDLYESNSMFSLTCNEFFGHESISTSKLELYKSLSRNIYKNNDFSKNTQNLFMGGVEITKLFVHLPKTKHDPFSFVVDVPFDSEQMTHIIVTGVFKENSDNLMETDHYFSFQRSFFLCTIGSDNEFVIRNEHLHVANVTNTAKKYAFCKNRESKLSIDQMNYLPVPKNDKQKNALVNFFANMTMLMTKVARVLLEKAEWNIHIANGIYKYDLLKGKIPENCFQEEVLEASVEIETECNY